MYIPTIGKDGVCDLTNELHEKRVNIEKSQIYYKISTDEEIKKNHGGAVYISDEIKLNIWHKFVTKLQPL